MKLRLALTLFLGMSIFNVYAQQPDELVPAAFHLVEVNEQWKHHVDALPSTRIAFETDLDRISYHLQLVIEDLRKKPCGDGYRVIKRMALLDSLEVYAHARRFPINNGHSERTPYFIDDFDTHCAVGYMMKVSGSGNLAERIRDEHNYDYLADIKTPGIMDWANEWGFSFDELAWIQPTYCYNNDFNPVDGGTDGVVQELYYSIEEEYDRIYFYGDFDSIYVEQFFTSQNVAPCGGLGYVENLEVHCLPEIVGEIRGIAGHMGVAEICGAIEDGGVTYPYARLEDGIWTYLSIPGREGYESNFMYRHWSMDQIYLALQIPETDQEELWVREGDHDWQLLATVTGKISSAEIYNGLWFAGEISGFEDHIENLPAESANLLRLFYCFDYGANWEALHSDSVPEKINDLLAHEGQLFIGGTTNDTENDIYLSKMSSSLVITPIFTESDAAPHVDWFSNYVEIRTMYSHQNDILIGGEWELYYDFYFAWNILLINEDGEMVEEFGCFSEPVNSINKLNGILYAGGEFINNYGDYPDADYFPIASHFAHMYGSDDPCEDVIGELQFTYFCQNDSVQIGNEWYSEQVLVWESIPLPNGCDSLVQHALIEQLPPEPTEDFRVVCEGDSILMEGEFYSEPGQYLISYDIGETCDSLVLITLVNSICSLDGCTNPIADNYNPNALNDDGSCTFDNMANVCGVGTLWDPIEQQCIVYCHHDSDNDLVITTMDLLHFLSVFGTDCP